MVVVPPDKRQHKRLAVSEPDALDGVGTSETVEEYDGVCAHLHQQDGEGKEEEEQEDACEFQKMKSGGKCSIYQKTDPLTIRRLAKAKQGAGFRGHVAHFDGEHANVEEDEGRLGHYHQQCVLGPASGPNREARVVERTSLRKAIES
jgi:hypothetical protein